MDRADVVPATFEDLRRSLGETAQEPMIALQLQELERVDDIKAGIYRRIEEGQADEETTAEYAKYNQRHNDTMKVLMTMLRARLKAGAGKPASPYTPEQADLVGIVDAKKSKDEKLKNKA